MSKEMGLLIFGYLIPLVLAWGIFVKHLRDDDDFPKFYHFFLVVMPFGNLMIVCIGVIGFVAEFFDGGHFKKFLKWFFLKK